MTTTGTPPRNDPSLPEIPIPAGAANPLNLPNADPRQSWARLAEVEQSLAAAPSNFPDQSMETARHLADCEAKLLELAASASQLEADADAAPRRLATVALRDWRRLARSLGEVEGFERCDRRLQDMLAAETDQWEQVCHSRLGGLDADECFDHWMQTAALGLEAVGSAPALIEPRQRLDALCRRLQQQLAAHLEVFPVSETQRQRWATELIDASELTLALAESLPAKAAWEELRKVADDIDWYVRHVEQRRGPWRRRLKRKRWRLRAEAQERLLHGRLVTRFGARNVARFDQLVLMLIVWLLAALVIQSSFALAPRTQHWLHLTDVAACLVLLTDFWVRWYYAPQRMLWFWRHFLIGLVPSIPYGLLLGGLDHRLVADAPQVLFFLRFLNLRPVIRFLRAFGFLARGIDRLARRLAPLLNRSVILYPTRAERQQARQDVQRLGRQVRRLHGRLQARWKQLVLAAAETDRRRLVDCRIDALEPATIVQTSLAPQPPRTAIRAAPREVPAEMVLRHLGGLTAQQALAELGEDALVRVARVVRIFSRRPLCWFPVIRAAVPRIGGWMNDGDVVAAAARRLAVVLKQYHDRWFWLADLHGTVTPSVFVDRLGTMLVKSSFRPAYRLALFGGVYLFVLALLKVTPVGFLEEFERFLSRFVGSALGLLSGICCIVFGLGWWLKRLAREATEFYEQAAAAQFLSLTEIIRSRHLERDAEIFHRRVLRPEWLLEPSGSQIGEPQQIDCFRQRVRSSLLGDPRPAGDTAFDLLERVVLLYRDSLDGALLADNDYRTTCQLLGNPAVRQFLALSMRIGRREVRSLRFLDLERQKSLLGGPYLWFNFISRATAHSVACLIVDYNQQAIPLAETPLLTEQQRRRYDEWLSSRGGLATSRERAVTEESTYVTTAFTALHFLDFDPQRDAEVAQRFGAPLVQRLRRDRSLLVRRLFGTYPWHLRPKEFRILNLYALYERWLSGGRALLVPLYVVWGSIKHVARVTSWIVRAVQEIRRPELRIDAPEVAEADFATAVRKIERMRGPVVMASLRLRAMLDPEFLGVPLPLRATTDLSGADVAADLAFLNAEPWLVESIDRQRHRAAADMRRLGRLIEEGLLARVAANLGRSEEAVSTPAHIRAAAVAYLADLRGVRRLLSAGEIIEEVYERAALEPPQAPTSDNTLALGRLFRRYWKEHAKPQYHRAACWWATLQNFWGVADALRIWRRRGADARHDGERILTEILRHPGRITEQLVTMRSVQTLAMLDILNYRRHIYELGEYAAHGDPQESLVTWNTLGEHPQ